MKEITYNELNGKGSFFLTVVCTHCKREINRTRVLDKAAQVRKMFNDAQDNPMVNQCHVCHTSGKVHIWEMNSDNPNGKVYLLNIGTQKEEISHYCFEKCGMLSVSCVSVPTEDGSASFMQCRNSSCKYAEKELDLGPGKSKGGIISSYAVRKLFNVK